MSKLAAIFVSLICALLGSLGQTFFKLGSAKITGSLLSWITNWQVIIGLLLYSVSAVMFIVALKYGQLSILYPMIATSYIWVTLISALYLKEPVNIMNWAGVFLILVGIGLLAMREVSR